MAKKITRKEELLLLLKAISLPLLVVEITHNFIKYKPINYPELKILIEEELAILEITVYI